MQRAQRGPGRPPGSTSDATRANILSAARICFARKGFGLATNQDIAKHAGITPAAIYQYFDSKLALYVAAAREAMIEVAAQMRVPAADEDSAAAAMSGMVMSLLAVHEKDPTLAAFLSVLPNELQRHPELAQHIMPGRGDVATIMSGVVERAVASGELDAKDAVRAAEMFIACLMGLSQYAVLKGRGRPIATAFADLLAGRLFTRAARPARATRTATRTAATAPRSRRAAKKPSQSRRSA
jgi:AcrR family transcriptional regulator